MKETWFGRSHRPFVLGLVTAGVLAATMVSGAAAQLFVENFAYTPGTLITAAPAPGPWSAHSLLGTNPVTVTSSGLFYTGYVSSGIGNAVNLTTSGEDDNHSFSSRNTGSVYAAAMVNVSASQATGDYFFHLNGTPVSSAFFGRVFAKKDTVSGNFAFGVQYGSSGVVYTPSTYTHGITYLVVVKYTFVPGATNNDVVNLFVNPVPGDPEPAPLLTHTNPGAAGTDVSSIGAVSVRQGTATAAPTVRIDGIRVGTTWESVVATTTFTISASAGPGGSIGPNGFISVNQGSNQSFTITPSNSCFNIADVVVDGASQGAISSYTFTNVQANHTISATFAMKGPYIIQASADPGGTISPSGNVGVSCGDQEEFSITPNACFTIADVVVDGVSQGAISSYTFTNVQAGHTISASFSPVAIHASAGPGGSISPSGDVTVACGSDQTFTIEADACHTIADVVVDGVSQGAIAGYTFTNVQASHTIAASFSTITYTIDASAGTGGTISPSGSVSVACAADQAFTIAADACHTIADVVVDGVSQGAIASYTFTNVTAHHTISATFSANSPHTIEASAGPGGTISPSGSVSVACGADQAFSIAADGCFSIADVVVDGVSQGAMTGYTFTNVQASHTISATFGPATYTIAASAATGGTITPSGDVSVACAGDQAFSIAADACHTIADVVVDGVSQGAVAGYTFTNVQASHTITATFSAITYTIDASAGTGGTISPSGGVSVACGADQAFSIAGDACHSIADVVVDGASQGAITSYTFTSVTAHHTISATFSQNGPHTIEASAGPGGTISPSGGVSVACGADQAFAIAADDCYLVADVQVDGSSVGVVTDYTFTNVRASHSISVTFVAVGSYTIAASAGTGGTITPGGGVSVVCGADQAFSIHTDACPTIADVLVDGVSQGAISSYTFTNVHANHTISVTFTDVSFNTFAWVFGSGGSMTPTGNLSARCGTDQVFSITPDTCFAIADVIIDHVSQGPLASYTFANINSDHEIEVSFVASPSYPIETSVDGGGTISPSGETQVDCGGSQVYTITPDDGFALAAVVIDDTTNVGPVASYTFTNVTARHKIKALFTQTLAVREIPKEFGLSAAWPNPSKGEASFSYTVARSADIRVSIVDVAGRVVDVPAQGAREPGRYTVKWGGRPSVAAGMYFIRFDAAGQRFTRRLIISH